MIYQCRYSKIALYTTRRCRVPKQMMPKIFSWKVTPNKYDFRPLWYSSVDIQKSALYSTRWCLVSKRKMPKFFFFESDPNKYTFMLNLWLVLSKPPITGVFRWLPVRLENRKKFSAVKILSATHYKKPFLDSYYGFCWRGGGT